LLELHSIAAFYFIIAVRGATPKEGNRDLSVEEMKVNLFASEEHCRRIVETAHEGIWSTDRDFVTTFVNGRLVEWMCCAGQKK